MILVSSCLLGRNCKYSGGNNQNEAVIAFLKDKEYKEVCPEVLGKLPSPRPPAEIVGNRVYNVAGDDVTAAFIEGAEKALAIAKKENPVLCILKENSPSCGVHGVYDGTFTGKKIKGIGLTTRQLQENGFVVVSEKDIEKR